MSLVTSQLANSLNAMKVRSQTEIQGIGGNTRSSQVVKLLT